MRETFDRNMSVIERPLLLRWKSQKNPHDEISRDAERVAERQARAAARVFRSVMPAPKRGSLRASAVFASSPTHEIRVLNSAPIFAGVLTAPFAGAWFSHFSFFLHPKLSTLNKRSISVTPVERMCASNREHLRDHHRRTRNKDEIRLSATIESKGAQVVPKQVDQRLMIDVMSAIAAAATSAISILNYRFRLVRPSTLKRDAGTSTSRTSGPARSQRTSHLKATSS